MHKVLRELDVDLGERSYPIIIGQGLLGSFDLTPWVAGNQVMIVTNETVAPLYLEKARACFPGKTVDVVTLPDGEKYKDWQTLNLILKGLSEIGTTRNPPCSAFVGGVVGTWPGLRRPAISGACLLSRFPQPCCPRWIPPWAEKPASTIPWGKSWWVHSTSRRLC